VIVWRLALQRSARQAFAGEGARRWGGRWNPVGTAVVYGATTVSLAALEILGHVEPEEARVYWLYRVDVADAQVEVLDLSRLPRGWNAARPRPATAWLGGAWAASLRSLALLVPSVHVPGGEERNVLLNPRHPAFAGLAIPPPRRYAFDPRLLPR
jgi:RES domain-containing protein